MAKTIITNYPKLSAQEFYWKSDQTIEKCAEIIGAPHSTFRQWVHGDRNPNIYAQYWMYSVAKKRGWIEE